MRSPFGLTTGERPWARRVLSERMLGSGGGSRKRLRRSGGMNNIVLSRLGFGWTLAPIISAPRRKRSGATARRRTRMMWRNTETRTIVRRRHWAASSSHCSSKLSSVSALMVKNRNSKLETRNWKLENPKLLQFSARPGRTAERHPQPGRMFFDAVHHALGQRQCGAPFHPAHERGATTTHRAYKGLDLGAQRVAVWRP